MKAATMPRTNALIGTLLVGTLVAMALLSVAWTPYDPLALALKARLNSPSSAH